MSPVKVVFRKRPEKIHNSIIIYVVCANDSREYPVLKEAYIRAKHIMSCEQIASNGGQPPWWFNVAKDLLSDLYRADEIFAQAESIIICILNLRIMENGRMKRASKIDMMKIADAMNWIHQNEPPSIDITSINVNN